MSESDQNSTNTGLDAYGRRRLVQVVATLVITMAIYFLAAGRLNLPWAWVYLGIAIASVLVGGIYVLRRNPQAINERGRPPENQKNWDRLIVRLNSLCYLGVYIVAGLDARFGWTAYVPFWLHLLGAFGTILSSALTYAAMAHNPFLSTVVQISDQRGHRVATSGPYRIIRHPMYSSLILGWSAIALLLGSYWTLIPGLLASILMTIRTALEDRTLMAELPGYADYARHTRFRLLPGIW